MKKQIIAAAVAASVSAVALADVAISGAAQVNWTQTETSSNSTSTAMSHDLDLKIVGKSGDTSVTVDIENLDAEEAGKSTTADVIDFKNVYMTTKIGDIDVKMGSWYGGDSLLANGSSTKDRVKLSTDVMGWGVSYETTSDAAASGSTDALGSTLYGDNSEIIVSGSIGPVKVSHEMESYEDHTTTTVSTSYQGVNLYYQTQESDNSSKNDNKDALQVDATLNGVTVTYAKVDASETAAGTQSDAFFGTFDGDADSATRIDEADGFGIKTDVAGNTVQFRNYTVQKASAVSTDVDYNKVIVTRNLASGATAEVTFTDEDGGNETLDLELRVKF